MISASDELKLRRHKAIEKFLEDHAELFGIQPADAIDGGPFIIRDWCVMMTQLDLDDLEEGTLFPCEVSAAFFRPGMTYSQKLGLIQSLDESVRNPRMLDDPDDG
jgi:hypothetical protein